MIAKLIVLAVAMCILMPTPSAFAQMSMGNSKEQLDTKGKSDRRPGEPEPLYVDEKAYKSAVDRIPDKGAKFDPWGGVRETPAANEKPAAKR